MPNPSSSITFSRPITGGADTKPLSTLRDRGRSARSGSRKLRSWEFNHVPAAEAFEQMFVSCRRQFVAMAYSIVRNAEDAEDAVQNAFISGYRHLGNFQGRSALKTWFTRVVLNAALMILRKRKSVPLVAIPECAADRDSRWMGATASAEPDPEARLAKVEALALIEELIAQLKPRLRQAFLMYYGNDLSVSEARLLAGVSVSTFKARLFRARHQLINEARRALACPRKPDGFSAVS